MGPSIAVLGEYTPAFPPHAATDAAIDHSRRRLGAEISAQWLSTAAIGPDLLDRYTGIWVAPGSPYRDMAKTLWAVRRAREGGVPCFGTCGGFQHMVLEYARNVLGLSDAQHAEYDPYASTLFISELECSLAGREMRLEFAPGSRVAAIYGELSAIERYYCNFGVDPGRVEALRQGPLAISGSDAEGEVRVVELPDHPFFLATLFAPQARSTPERPHPLVTAFLEAVLSAPSRRSP